MLNLLFGSQGCTLSVNITISLKNCKNNKGIGISSFHDLQEYVQYVLLVFYSGEHVPVE